LVFRIRMHGVAHGFKCNRLVVFCLMSFSLSYQAISHLPNLLFDAKQVSLT